MGAKLIKDLILKSEDLPYEDVTVPEWGGAQVRVMAMTAQEGETFSNLVVGKKKLKGGMMAELLVMVLRDPETGERIFQPEDAEELGSKSAHVLQRLFQVAQRLSALTADEAAEIEGN